MATLSRDINVVVRGHDHSDPHLIVFEDLDDAAQYALDDIRAHCSADGHRLEDFFQGEDLRLMRTALDGDPDFYEDPYDRYQVVEGIWNKTQSGKYWIELAELVGKGKRPRWDPAERPAR